VVSSFNSLKAQKGNASSKHGRARFIFLLNRPFLQ
jgi:hypothetical protein